MKKAKLMLTSLAVVAIVGSALAYKVSNDKVYIDTNDDHIADSTITGWTFTTFGGIQTTATSVIGAIVVQTLITPSLN